MNADSIVDRIGKGARAALKLNQRFLGIDRFLKENAKIRPEYVATVKIAEEFIGWDSIGRCLTVKLECQMKELKKLALELSIATMKFTDDAKEEIAGYRFGKIDQERLDFLVQVSEHTCPPILIAEVKLGATDFPKIAKDINRIVRLLMMYEIAKAYSIGPTYGAVVFHCMSEGVDERGLDSRTSKFLEKISQHCNKLINEHSWLNIQSGLLDRAAIVEDESVEEDYDEDGNAHQYFGKDKFAFKPGLVLMGRQNDVMTVKF